MLQPQTVSPSRSPEIAAAFQFLHLFIFKGTLPDRWATPALSRFVLCKRFQEEREEEVKRPETNSSASKALQQAPAVRFEEGEGPGCALVGPQPPEQQGVMTVITNIANSQQFMLEPLDIPVQNE